MTGTGAMLETFELPPDHGVFSDLVGPDSPAKQWEIFNRVVVSEKSMSRKRERVSLWLRKQELQDQ